jgi:hypothetical protein
MGRFVKVATTDEMPDQAAKCVEVDGQGVKSYPVKVTGRDIEMELEM